jgi:1-acyl-sn-glycerol-3-phosphate acyltransferase
LLKLLFGVSVDGREHLASLDQFILVANHNSHLDVFMLFQLLNARQLRNTHPVAAYDYFCRSKLLLWLVTFLFHPVWVTRGERKRSPLAGMRRHLQQGHSLIVFPEGSRGQAGEIATFKTGVGQLATEFPGVPVLPVYLSGPERALPKDSPVPVPLWNRLTVAPPLLLSGSRQQITATLERRLRDLAASQAVARHRRGTNVSVAPLVAVVGIDGSGKSSLARELSQRLSEHGRVCLITDDIAFYDGGEREAAQQLLKEHLREAIGRRAKSADSLRSYKIPKLTELLLRDHIVRDVRRWYAPDLIVMDGAPLINVSAWCRIYKGEAFDEEICASALRVLTGTDVDETDGLYQTLPELATLKRLHLAHLELPAATLFIDVDPAISLARIEARGVTRQVHETHEKLGKLREGYRLVCGVVAGELHRPTCRLDGDRPLREVTDTAITELQRMLANEIDDGVIHEPPQGAKA